MSLNVKGLNHPAKRSSLWRTAQESRCEVLCIQETHFKITAEPLCTNKNFTHIFKASGPEKKKSVMIAIKNTCSFTLHNSLVEVEGRYLALDCTLNSNRYTVITIYAPNKKQIHFLSKLMKKINRFKQGQLMICGDFNIVPDNSIDSSSQSHRLPSPMGSLIRTNDLYDVWRRHHTTERDYSYFPPRHNSYTRIDYFLVDKWTLPNISSSEINTITWSDHAPVTMTLEDSPSISRTRIWRANAAILNSPTHSTHIRKCLEEYFATNSGSVQDNTTLWNAHKAFIRGILIQIGARERRRRSQRLNLLTSTIKSLETQNQSTPDQALKKKN